MTVGSQAGWQCHRVRHPSVQGVQVALDPFLLLQHPPPGSLAVTDLYSLYRRYPTIPIPIFPCQIVFAFFATSYQPAYSPEHGRR